jgi:hypothetical protein
VPLILRHQRFDFGNLPDLVPQWIRVTTGERSATPPAVGRFERLYGLAVFRGDERAFVFRMFRLTSRLLAGSLALPLRFGMRMFGTRRQRRIASGLLRRR